jgi:hypothetical protein
MRWIRRQLDCSRRCSFARPILAGRPVACSTESAHRRLVPTVCLCCSSCRVSPLLSVCHDGLHYEQRSLLGRLARLPRARRRSMPALGRDGQGGTEPVPRVSQNDRKASKPLVRWASFSRASSIATGRAMPENQFRDGIIAARCKYLQSRRVDPPASRGFVFIRFR